MSDKKSRIEELEQKNRYFSQRQTRLDCGDRAAQGRILKEAPSSLTPGWATVLHRLRLLCMAALLVMIPAATVAGETYSAAELEAREEAILGKPPRIAPLAADELDAESTRVIHEVWSALGVPPQDDIPEYFTTMLRHPGLMLNQAKLSIQLFRGALAPRERELAILRIGLLCRAPYEWGEHVQTARRVGISSEEIERVTIGSTALGWSEQDRAILRAVEELYGDAMISDATWTVLETHFDEQQLLELPVLVGFYQSIAYLQNSVRFRLEDNNRGLLAR